MNVIIPLTLDDAMLDSSTIAEPDPTTETTWVSGDPHVLGDRRIRTTTHRVYECVLAHTGRAVLPENDPTYWLDYGPTLKWAMFDNMVSTKSTDAGALTVVLSPGFFNAIALYGLVGDSAQVVVRETPAGTVVYDSGVVSLVEDSEDWYEWLFAPITQKQKLVFTGILPCPEAELTITVTGATASCGMAAIGDYRSLNVVAGFGPQFGAKAEPIDNSYIKTNPDGTTKIVRRNPATDLRVEVLLAQSDADRALRIVQELLAVPAAWITTELDGYAGLNVFGLGSGSMSYPNPSEAALSIYVKGLV